MSAESRFQEMSLFLTIVCTELCKFSSKIGPKSSSFTVNWIIDFKSINLKRNGNVLKD